MDWKKMKASKNVQYQSAVHKARPKGDPLAPRPGFMFTDKARYRVMRGDRIADMMYPNTPRNSPPEDK